MSQRTEDIYLDADWLTEGFLIAECIRDPADDEPDDSETLHPELLRHLTREAVERGDFTLRYWRGEFYRWSDGRYIRVSDSDMKARLVCHLKEHNRNVGTFVSSGEKRINITSRLVTNVLLCLAGTEGVHLPEDCELNTWDDDRQRLGIQTLMFADKSMGLWRRLLFVPFENSYPEHRQNPDLAEQLSEELPGIFNWAFEGLKRLERAGRFVQPEKCKQAISDYRRGVNPARAFLLNNYVASIEYEGLPSMEVYQAYVRWCENNGYRPMNHNNFGKEVKRTLPGVRNGRLRIGARRVYFYHGIAVQEGSEVATESIEKPSQLS